MSETGEEAREGDSGLALVVADADQPAWVARLALKLRDAGVRPVVLVDPQAAPPSDAAGRRPPRSPLLYRLFARYDRRRAAGPWEPERRQDLVAVLGEDHVVRWPSREEFPPLGLYLADGVPGEGHRSLFPRGLFTVRRNGRGDWSGAMPVAGNVLHDCPVVGWSLLFWPPEISAPVTLLESALRVDRLSARVTAVRYQAHLVRVLSERLAAAVLSGCQAPSRTAETSAGTGELEEVPMPGEVGMARALVRLLALRAERGVREKVEREDWVLAVARVGRGANALDFDPQRPGQEPTLLLPPADRIWADPFVHRRSGRRYVFFEEMPHGAAHGHIALLELTDDLRPVMHGPVLSASHHLSYPFVFDWRGATFMLPETEQAGRVELHRCTHWPDTWTLEAVVLDGVSAVDATPVEVEGRWWLFTTMNPDRTGDWDTNLYIFHAKTPLGAWQPHPCNPVKADVRSSRSAGRPFWHDGRLFRPAQDCGLRYGHAIVVNEVVRLDTTAFAERPVHRIGPGWRKGITGLHTISQDGDLLVLDCRMRRWKRG